MNPRLVRGDVFTAITPKILMYCIPSAKNPSFSLSVKTKVQLHGKICILTRWTTLSTISFKNHRVEPRQDFKHHCVVSVPHKSQQFTHLLKITFRANCGLTVLTWLELNFYSCVTLDLFDHLPISSNYHTHRVTGHCYL